MTTTYRPRAVADLRILQQALRRNILFQLHPTQVAAKEIVKFTPPQTLDVALAEADRKLAAGESLLPKQTGSVTILRRA